VKGKTGWTTLSLIFFFFFAKDALKKCKNILYWKKIFANYITDC
jgi:hypothetical protein